MNILKSKEVKIALWAIIALFILVWGVNFLKGIDIFKKQYKYHVVFEKTDGLLPAHFVVVNGMVVGNVDDIALLGEQNNKILVTINVNKDIKIPLNSEFLIGSPSPLSSPEVDIYFGNAKQYLQQGDTIIGTKGSNMLEGVGDLVANLKAVSHSLDTVMLSLKETMKSGTLDSTLNNLQQISDKINIVLAHNTTKVDNIVNNVDNITTVLSNESNQLATIITNLNQFSTKLSSEEFLSALDDISLAIGRVDSILNKVENGQGTVGQLVVDDSLYVNLKNSMNSLDKLLIDIKENPKKYINVTVFGKKEKK